jgi:hypothetical protein
MAFMSSITDAPRAPSAPLLSDSEEAQHAAHQLTQLRAQVFERHMFTPDQGVIYYHLHPVLATVLEVTPLLLFDLPALKEEIPTAATDGVRIYLNIDFFKKMMEEHEKEKVDALFLLAHEVRHITDKHIHRTQSTNRSQDAAINTALINEMAHAQAFHECALENKIYTPADLSPQARVNELARFVVTHTGAIVESGIETHAQAWGRWQFEGMPLTSEDIETVMQLEDARMEGFSLAQRIQAVLHHGDVKAHPNAVAILSDVAQRVPATPDPKALTQEDQILLMHTLSGLATLLPKASRNRPTLNPEPFVTLDEVSPFDRLMGVIKGLQSHLPPPPPGAKKGPSKGSPSSSEGRSGGESGEGDPHDTKESGSDDPNDTPDASSSPPKKDPDDKGVAQGAPKKGGPQQGLPQDGDEDTHVISAERVRDILREARAEEALEELGLNTDAALNEAITKNVLESKITQLSGALNEVARRLGVSPPGMAHVTDLVSAIQTPKVAPVSMTVVQKMQHLLGLSGPVSRALPHHMKTPTWTKAFNAQTGRSIFLPGTVLRPPPKVQIAVIIDTSGSLFSDEKNFHEVVGRAVALASKAGKSQQRETEVIVFFADTRLQNTGLKVRPEHAHTVPVCQGGGTDFEGPLCDLGRLSLEERQVWDGIVYFTDGEAAPPDLDVVNRAFKGRFPPFVVAIPEGRASPGVKRPFEQAGINVLVLEEGKKAQMDFKKNHEKRKMK